MTPKFAWCCTGSTLSQRVIIDKVYGFKDKEDLEQPFRVIDDSTLDVTTASDWMEFIERSEGRLVNKGGAGAYDTLRCDLILGYSPKWNVWGEEYHLDRLVRSYRSLIPDEKGTQDEKKIKSALKTSKKMLKEMLRLAEAEDELRKVPSDATWQDTIVQLVRFTWLWSVSDDNEIKVRAHLCCSGQPVKISSHAKPIVVSIALRRVDDHRHAELDHKLPERHTNPDNKIASWTRIRKQLEKPHYKPPGAQEVLMVRPHPSGDMELLEGLSSNLFVIYHDNTIRTASNGVLSGYVRYLVLEYAEEVGLRWDRDKPILLNEPHLWKETFITSSSRLIYPIERILIHDKNESFAEYWRITPSDGRPKWQELLVQILRHNSYAQLC